MANHTRDVWPLAALKEESDQTVALRVQNYREMLALSEQNDAPLCVEVYTCLLGACEEELRARRGH